MSTYPVTLLFADGVSKTAEAIEGQKLLEVAESLGLNLLTDCSNGQCGTCVAKCVSGQVGLDSYDASVLPDDERDDGAILCCVAKIQGPAVIEMPYDASEASGEEAPGQVGRVVEVQPVAEEIMRLVIEVPEPVFFLPGQYVRLQPEGVDEPRSYSMANESGAKRLVFYVRTVPGGKFSTWLTASERNGSEVAVSAPRGSFFLRETARPRLLIAGGTGLAPFLAMLKKIANDASSEVENAPTRLLIGARTGKHLFGLDELEELRGRIPNLKVEIAAEVDVPAGCVQGYPTDLIGSEAVSPDTQIYLCGPPPMVDAARAASVTAGAKKSEILCERFA